MSQSETTVSEVLAAGEKKAAFWFSMIKVVGWPGLILIVIGLGLWRVFDFTAPYFVRIVETHITVTTGLLEQQKAQNETQARSLTLLAEIKENQRLDSEDRRAHKQLLEKIHNAIISKQNGKTSESE